ncbi:hypothetical protein HanHA300_Chr14g0533651 [Helianthus annuus]|nr:hypothetical protein HanHA300_Chr14g0533651 [Helianthus annuus]KAJ0486603.1 hypothetical protein HanHA89_Chr14g0581471 [Helianthus annuus]
MQDIRNCYDGLLSAAAAMTNSIFEKKKKKKKKTKAPSLGQSGAF